MLRYSCVLIILVAVLCGCSSAPPSGAQRSRVASVRTALAPHQAAACFAHNAEEHSSALVAEVRTEADRAEVIVRVKNGVLYGTAEFSRSGTGSTATVQLNVVTNSRGTNLVETLLEGC